MDMVVRQDTLHTFHLLPHTPQVVLGVQQFLPAARGGRGFARKISVIDSGQPGEQDDPTVSKHFVKEHLACLIVTANFDCF